MARAEFNNDLAGMEFVIRHDIPGYSSLHDCRLQARGAYLDADREPIVLVEVMERIAEGPPMERDGEVIFEVTCDQCSKVFHSPRYHEVAEVGTLHRVGALALTRIVDDRVEVR